MEYIWPSHRIEMATLELRYFDTRDPSSQNYKLLDLVSGNHYNHGRVGVKVVLRISQWWWDLPNLFVYMCIKCYSIDIIDNCYCYVSNFIPDIVHIDLKLNRYDAKASYVENINNLETQSVCD